MGTGSRESAQSACLLSLHSSSRIRCAEIRQQSIHNSERQEARVRLDGLLTSERHDETLQTMPKWLASYAAQEDLALPAETVAQIFFTNFFVSRVEWWLRPEVQRFLRAVDESSNIYTHRWGDAPIQTTALQLFAAPASVVRLPVHYLHASTMNRVYNDGHEADGWADMEMQLHPLVRAYNRRMLVDDGIGNGANRNDCHGNNSIAINISSSGGCTPPTMGDYVSLRYATQ